ncbi:hypothetical protein BH23GEM2_BH23GEM2_10170 [soil metagenome]
MKSISSAVVGLLVFFSAVAEAQFYPVQRDPSGWFSFGVGAFNAGEVDDGKTGTTWDFGNKTSRQYRVTLERALRGGMSYGLAGTFVRAPIQYSSFALIPDLDGETCASCDAEVDIMSLYALFHAGGGAGFHQVIEAGVGVTSYQNFKRESDGAKLAPTSAERDFGFVFAYGFGYTLSPRSAVNLVQEYGFNLHESQGAPSGGTNAMRFGNTRLSFRLGLGGNAPPTRPRRR